VLRICLAGVAAGLVAAVVMAVALGRHPAVLNAGPKTETVEYATGPIPAGTSLLQAQQLHLLGTEVVPAASLTRRAVRSLSASDEHQVLYGTVPAGRVILYNMLTWVGYVIAGGSFRT